jgi:hypothetical protein
MFAACPHCHFLIALHPQKRVVPATCPRCGKQVDDDAATAATAAVETGEELPRVSSSAPAVESDAPASPDAEPASIDAAVHKAEQAAATDSTSHSSPAADPDTDLANATDATDDVAPIAATAADTVATPRENRSSHPSAGKTAIPNFTRSARTTGVQPRVPRWQWATLIVLALVLALQTLLADRARLATDAGWRPLLTHLCGVFGCSIPVWHQPDAFTMLSRDVRPVAGSPGTLQAQATFRNDARWAQAWPIVLLTLKDADGRTLGARALTPSEYLDAGQAQSEIAPGQSAQIAVRIREPSANVVAFSFDFR